LNKFITAWFLTGLFFWVYSTLKTNQPNENVRLGAPQGASKGLEHMSGTLPPARDLRTSQEKNVKRA
jgi:hypothetical protein